MNQHHFLWALSLGLFGGLSSLAACRGNVAYVGALDPTLPDGSSAVDSSFPVTPDAGSDAPDTAIGEPICLSWGGCRPKVRGQASGGCQNGETLYLGEYGCGVNDNVCCFPGCHPAARGCPPGMMLSPLANAPCAANEVACIPDHRCASQGGSCENGTGVVDPCTANGRPIGDFSCPGAKDVCCLPKRSPSPCSAQGGACLDDPGNGLVDPCTALGRPIGAFVCPGPRDACCLANFKCCRKGFPDTAADCSQGTCTCPSGYGQSPLGSICN